MRAPQHDDAVYGRARALVCTAIERSHVAAVVREPSLLADAERVGMSDMVDPLARQAWLAIRALEHNGEEIAIASVVGMLEVLHGVNTCSPNQVRAWLEHEVPLLRANETIPRSLFIAWGNTILEFARRREAALEAERSAP